MYYLIQFKESVLGTDYAVCRADSKEDAERQLLPKMRGAAAFITGYSEFKDPYYAMKRYNVLKDGLIY